MIKVDKRGLALRLINEGVCPSLITFIANSPEDLEWVTELNSTLAKQDKPAVTIQNETDN